MILDAHNQFADAQAVTADTVSENVIDLKAAGLDIGVGEPIWLVVSIQTTIAGAGDTLDVVLQTDDNAAMASPTVILAVGTFPAESVAGTRFIVQLPPSASYEQYLALRFDPNGAGDLTAGNIDAFLTKDIQAFTAYPDNITIS